MVNTRRQGIETLGSVAYVDIMRWRRQRAAHVPADYQLPTQAEMTGPRGTVLGYLGVEIVGDQVWTIGGPTRGQYLGLLAGARAGLDLPGLSAYGVSATTSGIGAHRPGTISVTFATGARHERALRPGALLDASKIEAQIARFNALADASGSNW